MEGFIVISLITILLVLIFKNGQISSKLDMIKNQLFDLQLKITFLEKQLETKAKQTTEKTVIIEKEIIKEKEPVFQERKVAEKPEVQLESQEFISEQKQEPVKKETQVTFNKEQKIVTFHKQPTVAQKERKPSFLERNPDLEKFIGENLLSKIGIVILVLGVAFFVKWAIDKEYINEIGRVSIGILCGGILIGTAHWLHKNFIAFSSVLLGGGLATLYFTIALAFQQYHIFPQSVAFVIMLIITAFSVIFSLAYNRIELAIFAILGGFATPLMVSTGQGNYIVLFSYITLLNVGMLVLAYFKKWNLINIISYIFTILLFGAWLTNEFNNTPTPPYSGAFIYATIFYLIFFVMNIINNIRLGEKFQASEMIILLSNSFLYYAAGMFIIHKINPELKGLFTGFVAIFNFAFAFLLYKKKSVDKILVFMLIGMVLTFISLIAPVQLAGNYITLFWAAEATLLVWLSQQSGIKIMRTASVIVLCLMLISLIMDWNNLYFPFLAESWHNPILLNKAFITGFVSAIAILISVFLLYKEPEENQYALLPVKFYKNLVLGLFIIILYLVFLFEIDYQVRYYLEKESIRITMTGTYNFFYLTMLMLWERNYKIKELDKLTTSLGFIAIISYFSYYQFNFIQLRTEIYMQEVEGMASFIFHYISIALLVIISLYCYKNVKNWFPEKNNIPRIMLWGVVFMFVFILSSELDHVVVLASQGGQNVWDLTYESHRIGFPILWGICSFILMLIGMQKKNKDMRIISIALFFLTLLKLFLFDVWKMSEGGKIAAFISLGIILLIVSFLYQRLKKLILEGEIEHKEEENRQ